MLYFGSVLVVVLSYVRHVAGSAGSVGGFVLELLIFLAGIGAVVLAAVYSIVQLRKHPIAADADDARPGAAAARAV